MASQEAQHPECVKHSHSLVHCYPDLVTCIADLQLFFYGEYKAQILGSGRGWYWYATEKHSIIKALFH